MPAIQIAKNTGVSANTKHLKTFKSMIRSADKSVDPGSPRQATVAPRQGAGVGVGMLRWGTIMSLWKSQRSPLNNINNY